ncbi:hypothetical protein [Nonomuraea typhae]|uniref:hypothetical protein n=1 Tax=Nonomuraea typhae TaxID=2603600 RepID=UPI0012FC0876|nr:hypothetical protein [Nonomuraea typhae]
MMANAERILSAVGQGGVFSLLALVIAVLGVISLFWLACRNQVQNGHIRFLGILSIRWENPRTQEGNSIETPSADSKQIDVQASDIGSLGESVREQQSGEVRPPRKRRRRQRGR